MRTLYVLLLLILLGTFWLVLNRVRKAFDMLTPVLGWMVGLVYFVLAPLTVLTLNGGFSFPDAYGLSGDWWKLDLAKPQFMVPYIMIWISLMLACGVGYFLCPSPAQRQFRELVISNRKLERIILITMACSVLDWIAAIWLSGGFVEYLASHWYTRGTLLIERFGSLYILYTRVSLVNQILFTSAAALYVSEGLRRRNTQWRFTSMILVFLLIEILMSRNRIFFALYLLALLASCWMHGRKKILLALVATAPIVILVFSVWGWVRADLNSIPDSLDTLVINADMGNRAVTTLVDVTEAASVMLALNIVNDYGNKYEYLYGGTYARLLTFFQLRILNPGRIPDFATITAAHYEPGAETTLGSTAIGEAYANFGLLGILVLPLFTWFAIWYSNWLAGAAKRRSLLTVVSFVLFIWFARGTFAENAVSLIGAALLIWALQLEKGLCGPATGRETLGPPEKGAAFPPTPANPLA